MFVHFEFELKAGWLCTAGWCQSTAVSGWMSGRGWEGEGDKRLKRWRDRETKGWEEGERVEVEGREGGREGECVCDRCL